MLVGDIYGGRDYTGIGLSGGPGLGSPRWAVAEREESGAVESKQGCMGHQLSTHGPSSLRAANTIASSFGKIINQNKVRPGPGAAHWFRNLPCS